MTPEEIQTLREKAIKALAQPESISSGDKSLRNRSVADAEKLLALLDNESAKVSGTTRSRIVLIQTSRG
jgi:hypothetical protein